MKKHEEWKPETVFFTSNITSDILILLNDLNIFFVCYSISWSRTKIMGGKFYCENTISIFKCLVFKIALF